jgi:hypothetical protein
MPQEQTWTLTFDQADHRVSIATATHGMAVDLRLITRDYWQAQTGGTDPVPIATAQVILDQIRADLPSSVAQIETSVAFDIQRHLKNDCHCADRALTRFTARACRELQAAAGQHGQWAVFEPKGGLVKHRVRRLMDSGLTDHVRHHHSEPVTIRFNARDRYGTVTCGVKSVSFLLMVHKHAEFILSRFHTPMEIGDLVRAAPAQLDVINVLLKSSATVTNDNDATGRSVQTMNARSLTCLAQDVLDRVNEPNLATFLVALSSWDGDVLDLIDGVANATV